MKQLSLKNKRKFRKRTINSKIQATQKSYNISDSTKECSDASHSLDYDLNNPSYGVENKRKKNYKFKNQITLSGKILKNTKLDNKIKNCSKRMIHQDMELLFENIYNENQLTIITEEMSKNFTEMNSAFHEESNPRNLKNSYNLIRDKRSIEYYQKNNSEHVNKNAVKKFTFQELPNLNNKTNSMIPKNTIINFFSNNKNENKLNDSLLSSFSKSKKLKINFKKIRCPSISNEFEDEFVSETNYSLIPNKIISNRANMRKKHIAERIPCEPSYEINFKDFNIANKIDKGDLSISNIKFELNKEFDFQGNLLNGKPYGRGVISYKNEGNQKNDIFFEGEFKNGSMNGKGKIFFKNGYSFEGYMKHDSAHGVGVIKNSEGEIIKRGKWVYGVFLK
jgi:hypothetical protein